jgi:hypothetical protein
MQIGEIGYERDFQVWLYTVSHAQLLLRSNRSDAEQTRVDILFKGVNAVQLPTIMRGLNMSTAPRSKAVEISKTLGVPLSRNDKVFVLRGADYVGFVVALVAFAHEDEGHHWDPSHFAGSFMPRNQP